MELSLILQGAFTGACAGLGCGSTCGSGMGVFLSGYLTSHSKGTGDSLRGFFIFYLGKILAVAGVCLGSSLLRRAVLDEASLSPGGWSLPLAADLLMVGMGVFLTAQWFLEKKRANSGQSHCGGCSHSSSPKSCERHYRVLKKIRGQAGLSKEDNRSRISCLTLLGAGAGYGLTPCAPLILMAGYAASLTPANALVSGSVFAASSALSPLLILALLSGVLSGKIKKEIPQYIDWFRLGAYLILIAIFAADVIQLL